MKNIVLARLAVLAISLAGTSAVYAKAIGVPAGAAGLSGSKHIATAQVVVGASAIARARPGRQSVTIENTGTNGLFIGDASVTGATGYILLGNPGGTTDASITLQYEGAIYGLSPSTTVSILELF